MIVAGLEIKGTLALPAWQVAMLQQGSAAGVGNSQQAFNKVPLVFRALQLRCNALASIPTHVYKGDVEVDWPFPQSLRKWVWQQEAALLLAGASFTLKKANSIRLGGIQWLNPFTVTVELTNEDTANTEFSKRLKFTQQTQGGKFGPWYDEDIVYLHEFDPVNDVGKGTAAAAVALGNAQLMDYMTRFAGQFFASGAMPVVALGIQGNLKPAEVARIENFFKRAMTGIANAFRVVAVSGDIKPAVITPPIKDLAWPDLSGQARSQVALAFGIPQTMLEDAANYATASEHRLSFYEETVNHRANTLEDAINTQLFSKTDYTIRFVPEELSIFQEDETERSGAFKNLVDGGIDPKLAMEVLGYDLSDEQWAAVAGMKKPAPQFNFGAPPAPQAKPEEQPPEMLTALRRYRDKALKRIKEGKSTKGLDFTHETLPAVLRAAIMGSLDVARTADEVRAVFANAGLYDPEGAARDMDARLLLEAFKGFAASLPAPVVNVTVPEQAPPTIHVPPSEVKVINEVKSPEVKVINEVRTPRLSSRHEDRKLQRDGKQKVTGAKVDVTYHYEEEGII